MYRIERRYVRDLMSTSNSFSCKSFSVMTDTTPRRPLAQEWLRDAFVNAWQKKRRTSVPPRGCPWKRGDVWQSDVYCSERDEMPNRRNHATSARCWSVYTERQAAYASTFIFRRRDNSRLRRDGKRSRFASLCFFCFSLHLFQEEAVWRNVPSETRLSQTVTQTRWRQGLFIRPLSIFGHVFHQVWSKFVSKRAFEDFPRPVWGK